MMNMMTGAVAINGGVGVMEVCRPQMAESVMQAAEQVTLNAHITLRELKKHVEQALEKRMPGYVQLMAMNPVTVARATVNGAAITVFENGYAVYETDDGHTVLDVNRCGDYRYDFTDGTHQIVPAAVFEETEWSVRLLMEGERRMEHTRSVTNRNSEESESALSRTGSEAGRIPLAEQLGLHDGHGCIADIAIGTERCRCCAEDQSTEG